MASGEAKVAVGARSALFAPAKNLGLIIVDEEHESSYKQEDAPRYHARDAAIKRAQICRAVAVLGSATPSLESVHNSRSGKYNLLFLPDRVNRKPLPLIKLVDLRAEWQVRQEDRPVLSLALQEAVRETLAKGEQALLFLNRRGFNTVALCLKCGAQVHCPDCSIPVTYHRGGKATLLCHYCNWQGPLPERCAKCGDGEIKVVGLGTERVEEEVASLFPKAKICRMDLDTTRREGSHEDIIGRFRRHDIDILIGTQMIAKGHDFPGVTLVGVVGADVGLALPDFRASERVFQLLVQVAGRAGRADKEGIIYLQTFHGDHPAIQAALKHDTGTFWKSELELRGALGYPPYSRLGLLLYRAKNEKKALAAAEGAARMLKPEAGRHQVEVRGPAPAGLFKLRGHYRFQVLLKSPKPAGIRRLIEWLDTKMETPPSVFRVVDLDPQSML
jgi:primosomal protein N' (replication factor Y) (superfamily II helicase)